MRRTFAVLILTMLLTGCGAWHGALPYSAAPVEDSSGMTVEQYAIGRLPGKAFHAAVCPKPARGVAVSRRPNAKRCVR
ncbi:MAG: hypothetical protein WB615_06390 [Candidatus Tumulicola sp.]